MKYFQVFLFFIFHFQWPVSGCDNFIFKTYLEPFRFVNRTINAQYVNIFPFTIFPMKTKLFTPWIIWWEGEYFLPNLNTWFCSAYIFVSRVQQRIQNKTFLLYCRRWIICWPKIILAMILLNTEHCTLHEQNPVWNQSSNKFYLWTPNSNAFRTLIEKPCV